MSNYLAIATVTAALSQLIYSAVSIDVNGANVTTVRPDVAANDASQTKVNIYLYQITPNAALRNDDLPTRRSDGALVQRPKIALDLHYLLTFYGDEQSLIPQRLLGSTVRTLQSEPMLTRRRILSITSPGTGTTGNPYPYLSSSTLADDVELVKFTPQPYSLEELSKLWSVFLQTPYTLSVAYQAMVVVIESEQTPMPVLPVQEPKVYVKPFAQPTITQIVLAVTSASGSQSGQPIVAGSKISILGTNLQSDLTIVRIGGSDILPSPHDISDTKIDVQLPASLEAGIQSALIIQQTLMGDPAVPHIGFVSNVMPFVLSPTTIGFQKQNIQVDAQGLVSGDIQVQAKPALGPEQQISLLLINQNPIGPGPSSYSFLSAALPAASSTISVPISGVKPGQYLVRIMVDGAESALENDKQNGLLVLP